MFGLPGMWPRDRSLDLDAVSRPANASVSEPCYRPQSRIDRFRLRFERLGLGSRLVLALKVLVHIPVVQSLSLAHELLLKELSDISPTPRRLSYK